MDLNHHTGATVDGWPEVVQSLATIISTQIGTRVFRREYGSRVPELIDAPMTDDNILAVYVAVAEAFAIWEPRYEVTGVNVETFPDGRLLMSLIGNYRPNAHLGDFETIEAPGQMIRFSRAGISTWEVAQ